MAVLITTNLITRCFIYNVTEKNSVSAAFDYGEWKFKSIWYLVV